MESKRSIKRTVFAILIGAAVMIGYFVMQVVFFAACMVVATLRENGSTDDKAELQRLIQERYYNSVVVWYFACALFASFLILLVLVLLKKFKKSNLLSEFGRPRFSFKDFGTLVLCIVSGMALNISLSSFLSILPLPEKWFEDNAESVNSLLQGNTVFIVLSVVIMPPIVEELIFRGVFHNLLKNAIPLSEKWAVVISGLVVSVAFGIFHGNILQGLYTCFVSFVLIYIFETTGYLLACIFFHIGFNGSAVLEYLLGSFYKADAFITNTVVFGVVWVGIAVAIYFINRKKSERIGAPESVDCG